MIWGEKLGVNEIGNVTPSQILNIHLIFSYRPKAPQKQLLADIEALQARIYRYRFNYEIKKQFNFNKISLQFEQRNSNSGFSSPQGSQRRDCRQVVLIRQVAVVQDQNFQTVDLLQRTQIKINSGETEIYCSQLRRDLKTDNK